MPLFTELPRRPIPGNPPIPGPIGLGSTGPYPLHRTGYERYSPSFLEPSFSETRLPASGFLGKLLAIVPVRRAKLAIQFYRQGGPTYIVAARLLGG